MLSVLAQTIAVAALLLAGGLPRTPALDLPPAAQEARIRAAHAPRPEEAGFVRVPAHVAPMLTAKAAVAVDLETGAVLYAKHPQRRRSIASLTKIAAALVVLEREPDLDRVVTVPADAGSIEGTRSWLYLEQHYTVRDLLRALLISSAADATITLADAVGGSRDAFVAQMNAKAASLGLTSLSFTNAVGMDAPTNYGSAADVATLLREAWAQPFVREALAMQRLEIRSQEGASSALESTNALLGRNGFAVLGGKTGTTDEAGEAFAAVGSVEGGRPMIVVVLGSEDRFADTKALLAWADAAWSR